MKYNFDILEKFIEYLRTECEEKIRRIFIKDLKVGMVLLEDIETENNIKVMPKNTTITEHSLKIINYYTEKNTLAEPVKVREIKE